LIAQTTIGQRATLGAAAVVVALAATAFVRWVSAPSYTVLYSDIDSSRLQTVIDALESDDVPYRLGGGGSRVLVPQADVYRIRASLAAAGVEGAVTPPGYELLDEQGISVSDFRQQVDYQRALEGELARTLLAMDDVTSATVHLVIPEPALFAEDEEPPSASVLVDSSGSLSEAEVETITFLVSSSVEGLEPNQVTVAHVSGQVLHAAGDGATSVVGNRNLRLARDYEAALASDISQMLANLLGPARASVVVRADLDFGERSTETETYNQESATPLKEQTITETFSGTGAAPAGSVGVDGAPVEVSGDGNYSYQHDEQTREFGVDRVVTRSTDAPGAVERLSVAVVVDDGTLTGLTTPPVEDITALVSAAVGIVADRGDTIQVTAAPFPAPAGEEEAPAEPGEPSPIMAMIPQAIGGLVLLGVVVGLFLMSRSRSKEPVQAWPGPSALPAESEANGLQQDVLQLVERQPEEIATLLRSWLADRRESR
jgi:flagellar M-ring protein FliF